MGWFFNRKKTTDHITKLHTSLKNSFGQVRQDTDNLYAWIAYMHNRLEYLQAHTHYTHGKLTDFFHATKRALPTKHNIHEHMEDHPDLVQMRQKLAYLENHVTYMTDHNKNAHTLATTAHATAMELPKFFAGVQAQLVEMQGKVSALRKRAPQLDEDYGAHIDRLTAQIGRLRLDVEPLKTQVFQTHAEEIEKLKETVEEKRPAMHRKLFGKLKRTTKAYAQSVIISYIEKYGTISAKRLKEILVDDQGILSKSSFYRHLEEVEQRESVASVMEGRTKMLLFQPGKHNGH